MRAIGGATVCFCIYVRPTPRADLRSRHRWRPRRKYRDRRADGCDAAPPAHHFERGVLGCAHRGSTAAATRTERPSAVPWRWCTQSLWPHPWASPAPAPHLHRRRVDARHVERRGGHRLRPPPRPRNWLATTPAATAAGQREERRNRRPRPWLRPRYVAGGGEQQLRQRGRALRRARSRWWPSSPPPRLAAPPPAAALRGRFVGRYLAPWLWLRGVRHAIAVGAPPPRRRLPIKTPQPRVPSRPKFQPPQSEGAGHGLVPLLLARKHGAGFCPPPPPTGYRDPPPHTHPAPPPPPPLSGRDSPI